MISDIWQSNLMSVAILIVEVNEVIIKVWVTCAHSGARRRQALPKQKKPKRVFCIISQ